MSESDGSNDENRMGGRLRSLYSRSMTGFL
jgi:hypothetical protein